MSSDASSGEWITAAFKRSLFPAVSFQDPVGRHVSNTPKQNPIILPSISQLAHTRHGTADWRKRRAYRSFERRLRVQTDITTDNAPSRLRRNDEGRGHRKEECATQAIHMDHRSKPSKDAGDASPVRVRVRASRRCTSPSGDPHTAFMHPSIQYASRATRPKPMRRMYNCTSATNRDPGHQWRYDDENQRLMRFDVNRRSGGRRRDRIDDNASVTDAEAGRTM
ncbi:hypothetical protein R3P38DRAFT_3230642 [Favolaschia claudopus]|uniref:Uncharacterized protein n=1 Tax=Favolaschia claudopus TaxID=2862362 RepID=A0AAV9ZME7_9AGAR